jgi:primosomal replication protein N
MKALELESFTKDGINNLIRVSGKIASAFKLSSEFYGEKFYTTRIQSKRKSGLTDIIPVTFSERILKPLGEYLGRNVSVYGGIRSLDKKIDDRSRLLLFIFADNIVLEDTDEPINEVELNGFVCKKPTFRITPSGREIADVMLSVNRRYNKSDHIPCVCWGRNARYASELSIGSNISLIGRFQSRAYTKLINGENIVRTAYELSVGKLCVLSEAMIG